MKRLLALLILTGGNWTAVQAVESILTIRVDRASATADVDAENVAVDELLRAAALRSGYVFSGNLQQLVTISRRGVPVDDLVPSLASEIGVTVERRGRTFHLIDRPDKTVSLDVVDERAGELIPRVAAECGIRNVMIDPGIDVAATFRFDHVPCHEALRIIFNTLGLRGELDAGRVLVVER